MSLLVSPTWLASRLHDPRTVVLDATLPPVGVPQPPDVHARYFAQHLPGAVFFDVEALSDHSTPLPHMLPTPEAFSRAMAALGVGSDDAIVVYEQEGVFSAPRAWWMLRTLGAHEVHLLDGGLHAWIEAGLPTEAGPVQRPSAVFDAKLDPVAVVSFPELQSLLQQHRQVLDARPAGRFAGTAPEPRPNLRSGHMPGATSIPSADLVRDGRLKPAAELAEIFRTKGVDLEQPVTTSCGSGITAAVVALGLELCGAKHVSLYDGSWAEYAAHPDAVIEQDR